MRLKEYTLSFEKILKCKDSNAHLAMRERVFLYSIIYSAAPQRVLEIGTFKGGSASIISAALDDLELDGKLFTIDPAPEQIEIDFSSIAHNSTSIKGYFPQDIEKLSLSDGAQYDFAFVDGNHSYQGVLGDLHGLQRILKKNSYVLLHDAYNADVNKAIEDAVAQFGYADCGRIGTVMNDTCGPELFGGFHLLRL